MQCLFLWTTSTVRSLKFRRLHWIWGRSWIFCISCLKGFGIYLSCDCVILMCIFRFKLIKIKFFALEMPKSCNLKLIKRRKFYCPCLQQLTNVWSIVSRKPRLVSTAEVLDNGSDVQGRRIGTSRPCSLFLSKVLDYVQTFCGFS
jgi:hypothetical protein